MSIGSVGPVDIVGAAAASEDAITPASEGDGMAGRTEPLSSAALVPDPSPPWLPGSLVVAGKSVTAVGGMDPTLPIPW